MKNLKTLLLTTTIAFTINVNAHDPSMHAKNAKKADCTGYNKMVENGAKIDMTDPVMLAMMKKCKNQKSKSESKCGDMSDGHHDKKADSKCGGMSDGHHDKKSEKKCGDMNSHDKSSDSKYGGDSHKDKK